MSGRTGHLYVKSSNGDVLYTNKTTQRGNGQRIYMEIPYNSTKSFAEGDKINVNGKDYSLSFDPYVEKYYVDLPKSAGGYGISNMPNFVVADANGDVLCATFTYKPDIQEFIPDNDASVDTRSTGESISFNTTVEEAQAEKNPCYVALKGTRSFELPNPAEAKLQTACSLISLLFKYESSSDTPKFSKLKVELSDDGFLSGEVTTCMYPDQSMYDPTYIVPETVYKNKSNILNINNTNNDNKVSFLAHPQYIRTIKCTAYDSEDKEVFKVETTLNQELKKGTNITYTFSIPR